MTRGELVSALWFRGLGCWSVGVLTCGLTFAVVTALPPFSPASIVFPFILGTCLGGLMTLPLVFVLAAISTTIPCFFARQPLLIGLMIVAIGATLMGAMLGRLGLLFAIPFLSASLTYVMRSWADPLDLDDG